MRAGRPLLRGLPFSCRCCRRSRSRTAPPAACQLRELTRPCVFPIQAGAVCTAPAVLRAHGLAARVQLLQLVCLGAACLGMLLWRRAAFQSAAPPARRRAYCRRFELTSLLFRICWFDVNGRDISAGPAGLLAGWVGHMTLGIAHWQFLATVASDCRACKGALV